MVVDFELFRPWILDFEEKITFDEFDFGFWVLKKNPMSLDFGFLMSWILDFVRVLRLSLVLNFLKNHFGSWIFEPFSLSTPISRGLRG